jgi:hypothetical protein
MGAMIDTCAALSDTLGAVVFELLSPDRKLTLTLKL